MFVSRRRDCSSAPSCGVSATTTHLAPSQITGPKRSKKDTALSKHRRWLHQMQEEKRALMTEAEREAEATEERQAKARCWFEGSAALVGVNICPCAVSRRAEDSAECDPRGRGAS